MSDRKAMVICPDCAGAIARILGKQVSQIGCGICASMAHNREEIVGLSVVVHRSCGENLETAGAGVSGAYRETH